MAYFIPLFPLSLAAFPGEYVNLHIFEPRYRQLINECIARRQSFGMPVVIEREMGAIASLMEVTEVAKRYSSGELDIRTKCVGRVEVIEFMKKADGKPYPGGSVKTVEDNPVMDIVLQQKVLAKIGELHRIIGITKDFGDDTSHFRAFDAAHHVGLNLRQEYALLAIDNENERLLFLHDHIEKTLPVITEAERLKAKAKLNGHFKKIPPTEW